MKAIERIALELGTNNTPRVSSLIRRRKIEYRTSGSPSCWSDWHTVLGMWDATRLIENEERRAGFGYTGIEFRIAGEEEEQ